jgi:hypothetical protein
MTHHFWRLSEGGDNNLGLACTDDGLFLGRTPLIERRDGRFTVRDRGEIERLFRRIDPSEPAVSRIMPGLHTVASAMNANDPCLTRIAAVHLRIADLADEAARDCLEAEDTLIKSGDWNPALHPRAGVPPNPGWFAASDGAANRPSPVRFAQNDDPARRSDANQMEAAPAKQSVAGWGKAETLDKHFTDHGGDFGAKTREEYVEMSQKFFDTALSDQNAVLRVDLDQKIVRIYDPATNTFGAYNLDDHTTRTFFKPSSETYWPRNAGKWGQSTADMSPDERRAFMARARGMFRGSGEEE